MRPTGTGASFIPESGSTGNRLIAPIETELDSEAAPELILQTMNIIDKVVLPKPNG